MKLMRRLAGSVVSKGDSRSVGILLHSSSSAVVVAVRRAFVVFIAKRRHLSRCVPGKRRSPGKASIDRF